MARIILWVDLRILMPKADVCFLVPLDNGTVRQSLRGKMKITDTKHEHKISIFSSFAKSCAELCGKSVTFTVACGLLVIWACSGSFFGFSDTWQLVINTGTTIITFLTVFLIQNTQNRDSETMQLKLDEIIKALKRADNRLLDLEDEADDELHQLHEHYKGIGREAILNNLEFQNQDGNKRESNCSNKCRS